MLNRGCALHNVTEFFLIIISTSLVNNLVLDYVLGVDPVIAVSKRIEATYHLCILMLIMAPVTAVITYLLHFHILLPLDLAYLQLISFVLAISTTILMLERIILKLKPALHEHIRLYIPIVIANSTVTGIALLNIKANNSMGGSFFFGLGVATGFSLVLLVITAMRERITDADAPMPFQGVALLLLSLGLMSMAFLGFTGIAVIK